MAEKLNKSKKIVKAINNSSYVIDFRGEPLGQGSFGQIRRIYDLDNPQKKHCCKIISIKKCDHLESALNELKIIQQLPENINIVNYEKIKYNTQEDMYIIMEYCDGGNLQEYLQKNDYLSEYEIKDFLCQFIQGYKSLYDLNILHRDLKPENILIHKKVYKIADFGLSKILEFKYQRVEHFGTLLTRAPELYPENYRDKIYKDVKDFSKVNMLLLKRYTYGNFYVDKQIDMFSLGVILYNLAYKEESHPYVGSIKKLFANNFQGEARRFFCQQVNASEHIEFPPIQISISSPSMQTFFKIHKYFKYLTNREGENKVQINITRSDQLIDLITKLCAKDVSERMSFDQLMKCDYVNQLQNQSLIEADSNIFSSHADYPSFIQAFAYRNSFRSTIYPQPQIDSISKIMQEMKKSDTEDNDYRYTFIDEYDISLSCIESIKLVQEENLLKKLDEFEEQIKRQDEKNQETYAIYDKCMYLREIIYFFDKVQLHLESIIKMFKQKIKPLNIIQDIDSILNVISKLRMALIYASDIKNDSIYYQLAEYYSKNSVQNFKLTPEFVKFESLRKQDEDQLKINVNSIQCLGKVELSEQLTLQALKTLSDIFGVFENLDEQEYKFEKRQTYVVYWYIYQVNRYLFKLHFFNSIDYEKNTNKFMQYYQLIDHYLTIDSLREKLIQVINHFKISCIIDVD